MSEGLSPTRIAEEAIKLLATSINEVVPPDAQLHLLAAQRELLLAVAVIVEHNAARLSRGEVTEEQIEHEAETSELIAETVTKPRTRRRRRTPPRPTKIELD